MGAFHPCRGEQCSPGQSRAAAKSHGRTLFAPTLPLSPTINHAISRYRKAPRADIESAPTPTEIWPRRGQSVGRRKSVKKNAALLHFLAFSSTDHLFGVLRGEQPLRRAPRLGSSGTFLLLFWSQKRRTNGGCPLNSSAPPQGGGKRQRSQSPHAPLRLQTNSRLYLTASIW